MQINYGDGKTEYGLGIHISLDGHELATAIDMYLRHKGVIISGPRTIRIDDEICANKEVSVYIDPSGKAAVNGRIWHASGPNHDTSSEN